jgi:hypothetical protein
MLSMDQQANKQIQKFRNSNFFYHFPITAERNDERIKSTMYMQVIACDWIFLTCVTQKEREFYTYETKMRKSSYIQGCQSVRFEQNMYEYHATVP